MKGEAAALSVRAQLCQSHYFSTIPHIYSVPPILTSVSTSWFWHFQEIIHTKYNGWLIFTARHYKHHVITDMQLVAYTNMLQDAVAAHMRTVLTLATSRLLVSQGPNTVSLQLPGQLVLLCEVYSSQEQIKNQQYEEKCKLWSCVNTPNKIFQIICFYVHLVTMPHKL